MLLKHVCETIQMALFCYKKRNLSEKLQHDYILLTEDLKMVFMFICERKKDCLITFTSCINWIKRASGLIVSSKNFVSQCYCIAGYVLFFHLFFVALLLAGQLIVPKAITVK